MTEAGVPGNHRIIDLVDVLEEGPSSSDPLKIHDLTDVVQDIPVRAVVDPALREMMLQRVTEVAERLAREMVPVIAERVIREEIEKLKAADEP
jgi:uncharacterized membrane-anchored protein YjiN (DUF445 family)